MRCLNRADQVNTLFKKEIKHIIGETRRNFNYLISVNQTHLVCNGDRTYNLDDICIFDSGDGDPDSARKPCTMMDKETKIELNP